MSSPGPRQTLAETPTTSSTPTSSPPSTPPSTLPPSSIPPASTPPPQSTKQNPPPTSTQQPPTSAPPSTAPSTSPPGPSSPSSSESTRTVIITSTASAPSSPTNQPTTTNGLSTQTSSSASSLPSVGPIGSGSSGLSPAGTIAVAVVVPVVSVALIILALLFWWRKRKARKLAEEERKQEIEEYRFNPNNDPTLPAVGMAGGYDDEPGLNGNNSGYRGWGASAPRRAPTNLSGGGTGGGLTLSDGGGNPGYAYEPTPYPEDDLRPVTGDSETIGALQSTIPMVTGNKGIHRGPSNASSAYSAAHSDVSDDVPLPGAPPNAQYYEEGNYYNDPPPHQGPYTDNQYGGGQPVIRDVQARRNTRIESPSIFPQQGNAGIAQNF